MKEVHFEFWIKWSIIIKKNLKSQVEFKTNYINIYPWIFTFKFIHVTNQTKFETSWCPKTITLIEKKNSKRKSNNYFQNIAKLWRWHIEK